jgi:hypothetical protein
VRLAPTHAASIGAATAVAGLVTLATRSGWIGVSRVAASPKAIENGKVWLLATSALVADRPWLPSLLGFAITGLVAASVAPGRAVVLAAVTGHILATLVVYGILGVVRAADPDAFGRLVRTADVGLSAMIAAWIGVVAAVTWRRYRSRRARVLDVGGCIACALIGFAFRPDVTFLDLEHIVAFVFGMAIAAWWPPEQAGLADLDSELARLLSTRARP